MAIYAFTGLFGSGKSALASWLAVGMAHEARMPLYANYGLKSARPVSTVAELYDIFDSIIVLDEIQNTIHSRSFSANMKTGFLDWFDQCRKQGGDLFLISQELAKLDVIVREMVEYLFVCEKGYENRVTGEYWSKIARYRRKPEVGFVPVGSGRWNRAAAFGLYDHRARAWKLQPGDIEAVAPSAPSAAVEVSPRRFGSAPAHFQSKAVRPGRARPA